MCITEDEPTIDYPFSVMLEFSNNWDDLCDELGLNPYLLNEGIADESDKHPVPLSIAKKYGLLPEEQK